MSETTANELDWEFISLTRRHQGPREIAAKQIAPGVVVVLHSDGEYVIFIDLTQWKPSGFVKGLDRFSLAGGDDTVAIYGNDRGRPWLDFASAIAFAHRHVLPITGSYEWSDPIDIPPSRDVSPK